MSRHDRLALAVRDAGRSTLPDAGDVLVLRAAPSAFLDLVPPSRLRCVQTLPAAARRAGRARAGRSRRAAEGPAAMVVVNLTRSRAENLGNVARGARAAARPAGGWW